MMVLFVAGGGLEPPLPEPEQDFGAFLGQNGTKSVFWNGIFTDVVKLT